MSVQVTISQNGKKPLYLEQLWMIYQLYHEAEKAQFIREISQYEHIAYFIADQQVVGFACLKSDRFTIGNKEYMTIGFGHMSIKEEYRGLSLLAIAAARMVMHNFRKFLTGRLFIWSNAINYKAYLIFAKTLDEFYPSYGTETAFPIAELRDRIGTKYFGSNYNALTGLTRNNLDTIVDPTVGLSLKYRLDKDIAFYTKMNPNFGLGDGLITLAPMTWANFYQLVKRFFRSGEVTNRATSLKSLILLLLTRTLKYVRL